MTSASSSRRSVIFPLPSSPHWAPTMTIDGIARLSLGSDFEVGGRPTPIAPHDRALHATPGGPGARARADLGAQLIGVQQVGRDHHRLLLLPALVDDRVE